MTAHQMLQQLTSRGFTQKQIQIGTGINQPTISRLLNNVQADLLSSKYHKLKTFYEEHFCAGEVA